MAETDSADRDAARAALRRLGRKYSRKEAERKAARDELFEAIRAGERAGITWSELVELSGVARGTVSVVLSAGRRPEQSS